MNLQLQLTGDVNGGSSGRNCPIRCVNPNLGFVEPAPSAGCGFPNPGFTELEPPGEDSAPSPHLEYFRSSTTPSNRFVGAVCVGWSGGLHAAVAAVHFSAAGA